MNKSTPPADAPRPTLEMLAERSGPFWDELCGFLEQSFDVAPRLEYSACSMARGWNVKYQKSGRSLCTLYPGEGRFTCLVVVGGREETAAELLLPGLSPATGRLYRNTKPFNGGRWLMLEITDEAACRDAKALIGLRVGVKGAGRQ